MRRVNIHVWAALASVLVAGFFVVIALWTADFPWATIVMGAILTPFIYFFVLDFRDRR